MSEGEARRTRVVVVEDDSDIASLLEDILESEGYASVSVADAAQFERSLDVRPDLVVLDLRLTRGGADQVMSALRGRGLGEVPVLLLSAATDLPERAKALGVSEYVAKPFELEELLAVVRRLV